MMMNEEYVKRRTRRALRWLRKRKGTVPPRHIAEAMGWRYRPTKVGTLVHVPRGA